MRRSLILTTTIVSLGILVNSCTAKPQAPGVVSQQSATHPQPAGITSNVTAQDLAIPRYQHIFVIIEENKAYNQIIGSPNAPSINQLARTYGEAANFFGEVHPSEANYIAMIGGSTFGIHDDAAYNTKPGLFGGVNHTIAARSLLDQLEEKGLSWKGYFQSLPYPGYKGTFYPSAINALYASKHNAFLNFKEVQNSPNKLKQLVRIEQLAIDLNSNYVPNYSHIVLNECNEMHGLPECRHTQQLIKTGDAWIGKIVKQITSSRLWSSPDNNAIVITWDEDNGSTTGNQGCCGYDPKSAANFGGGHIPTVVITNHGPRGVVDSTPYNHYSLLRTTEDAFGIHEYLNYADDSKAGVKPMTPLFKRGEG